MIYVNRARSSRMRIWLCSCTARNIMISLLMKMAKAIRVKHMRELRSTGTVHWKILNFAPCCISRNSWIWKKMILVEWRSERWFVETRFHITFQGCLQNVASSRIHRNCRVAATRGREHQCLRRPSGVCRARRAHCRHAVARARTTNA